MSGPPVVIVEKGGLPVSPVESNAPVLTVAANGQGAPVTVTEGGTPFIIEGYVPPEPDPED